MATNFMKKLQPFIPCSYIVDHRHCDTIQFQNGAQLILIEFAIHRCLAAGYLISYYGTPLAQWKHLMTHFRRSVDSVWHKTLYSFNWNTSYIISPLSLIVLQLACNFEPVWCRTKLLTKPCLANYLMILQLDRFSYYG